MKVPTRTRGRDLPFNITPLIDMTFLLIIFFLVASYLIRNERAEAVQLPEATQVEDQQTRPSLTVTITADETWHAQGRPTTLEEVEETIRSGRAEHGDAYEVRIRSDRSVEYRVVEPLLLAAARAGVTNVKFAVIAK